MGAKLMDGAAVARSLLADTKRRAAEYLNKSGRQPMLAAVLVGDDAGSRTYVAMKRRRCKQNGVSSVVVELSASTTTTELVKHITDLSADTAVDGILLLARDATVTFCHSKTVGLADLVRQGDVVVAAVGRPELIRGDWIKPGAVVIDAGYNEGNIGDVDFPGASARVSLITPVPGGVGPMTIAVLLQQTVTAAERQR